MFLMKSVRSHLTTCNAARDLCSQRVTCLAQVPVAPEQKDVAAEEVVVALEGVYGVHPGERRSHTKVTCTLGTFVGRPEGQRIRDQP